MWFQNKLKLRDCWDRKVQADNMVLEIFLYFAIFVFYHLLLQISKKFLLQTSQPMVHVLHSKMVDLDNEISFEKAYEFKRIAYGKISNQSVQSIFFR